MPVINHATLTSNHYRLDIDGYRAIAIISVVLYHLGYIENGYLGVDIFFVISGFLITKKITSDLTNGFFSIWKFYESRIRRIFPLLLFSSIISLIFGVIFMLPDDLENLCQSIFASNLLSNNFLMKITSVDYWAIQNDYKPLMHTWSLSIEEQFYVFYPLILLIPNKKNYIKFVLITTCLLSLILFLSSNNLPAKFYLIQYRFFELSLGGISAVFSNRINSPTKFKIQPSIIIVFTILLLTLSYDYSGNYQINVVTTIALTSFLLYFGNDELHQNKFYKRIISNKLIVFIGKISFSLYVWHQIVFAFTRYIFTDKFTTQTSSILLIIIFLLSTISYFLIEKPFRNYKIISSRLFFSISLPMLMIICGISFYIYSIGGIVENYPELGIKKTDAAKRYNFLDARNNIHIAYNERIRSINSTNEKNIFINKHQNKKVLVIGNSLGRDFTNVLLESHFNHTIQLCYSEFKSLTNVEFKSKINHADIIFIASNYNLIANLRKSGIDFKKIWIIGPKDFGNCNGIHHNKTILNYSSYRTEMKIGFYKYNQYLKKQWRTKYIDIIDLISDFNGRVLVYTPEGKFISHDTIHLTKFGAKYLAFLLNNKLCSILM